MVDDDSRAKKQEMSRLGANSDFISNLPDNVIDRILVGLPIRDAVRTSVLSTTWRYKWTTITQLVFHDELVLPSPHDNKDQLVFLNELVLPSPRHEDDKDKLINFINLVFLLYSGFIHKFELFTKCLPISSSSIIDAWILFLSRKNIKELVLNFSADMGCQGWKPYKLPTCFFSVQQISTLELRCCVLKKPPPTFTGFSYLKSLYLHQTKFVDKGGFEYCLISKCPLLERLTLKHCTLGLDHNLNICSPNLKFLYLSCTFRDICFENTPLLSDVSICLTHYIANANEMVEKFRRTETRNVIKVLSSLPSLKKFKVNEKFLKFLSLSQIPEKLPFTCHHLNNLTLRLNVEDVNDMCVTLCLLSSSPNLQELDITCISKSKPGQDIKNFWEKRTHIDWKMSRLQVVKITSYNGFEFKSVLEFIKLLLANSPMLEMLSIKNSPMREMVPDKKHMLLLLQLLRFKRASPIAVIEFPGFV